MAGKAAVEILEIQDRDFGTVLIRRSPRARNLSIRVGDKGVAVTVPRRCSFRRGLVLLEENREKVAGWLRKKAGRQTDPAADAIPARARELSAQAAAKASVADPLEGKETISGLGDG